MTTHGHVTWTELLTIDLAAAQQFYSQTLGWRYAPMPGSGDSYWLIHCGPDEPPVGGMMAISGPLPGGAGSHLWLSYFSVDDVDARVAGVVAAGGKILRAPFDVAGVGRIALIEDAAGAMAGWMTRPRG